MAAISISCSGFLCTGSRFDRETERRRKGTNRQIDEQINASSPGLRMTFRQRQQCNLSHLPFQCDYNFFKFYLIFWAFFLTFWPHWSQREKQTYPLKHPRWIPSSTPSPAARETKMHAVNPLSNSTRNQTMCLSSEMILN